MNNPRKRMLRRGLSALAGFLLIFSGVVYAGVQFPFFNVYNPLYNPYYFIILAVVFFAIRTYIKEKKMIWNSIGFFEPSGLTTMYDVPAEDVGMTHLAYKAPDGERRKVKHHHPFAIPSADGYDNVYLTPKNTVASLDPRKLWNKYSGLTDELKTKILELYDRIVVLWPEAEALDPHMLTIDETENDDPDTLNQELATTVADIRRGWLGKTGLKESWFYMFAGAAIGALVISLVFMMTGVNFSTVIVR